MDELGSDLDNPFKLDLRYSEGLTLVRDEEGEGIFVLPGEHGIVLATAVYRIRETAEKRGAAHGRFELSRDLRRLLHAPGPELREELNGVESRLGVLESATDPDALARARRAR